MKNKRSRRGVSLAETLIVIGIIVILMAVMFVGVARYRRGLHQLEMDGIAKEIFVAAQNHLSMAEEQAYLNHTEFGFADPTEGDKGVYYFLVGGSGPDYTDLSADTVLRMMLPLASVDETVRLGGCFVVRYQRYPAQVLDVFYAEKKDDGYGHIFTRDEYADLIAGYRGDDKKSDRRNYGSSDHVIGYFGGVEAEKIATATLLEPTLTIHNGDTLWVEIGNPNYLDNPRLKLLVTGDLSRAQKIIELDGSLDSQSYVLDDVTRDGFHFAERVADADTGTFIPGENITLKVVCYSDTQLANVTSTPPKTTNSLFAADSTADEALIASFRHLQNLDRDVSALDDHDTANLLNIASARQTDDLSWSDFLSNAETAAAVNGILALDNHAVSSAAGTYRPVTPDYDLDYFGQSHTISDVVINWSGRAGLFGTLNNSSVSDLVLLDFDVESTSDVAGALAGYVNGDIGTSLRGILVRNRAEDAALEITGAGSTGGLVGSMRSGRIDNCAAAVYVKSISGYAGGLAGSAENMTVESSYAGGHTDTGAYLTAASGDARVNVAGGIAGGLIGRSDNTVILHSYSTASAMGASLSGGLVGSAEGGGITDSYCTGLVLGLNPGAFAGSVSGVDTGSDGSNRYFSIINPHMPPVNGGGALSTVTPLDGSVDEYNDFVNAGSDAANAHPYDGSLLLTFLGGYDLRTASQLGGNAAMTVHYGDWPAPETLIVNRTLSSSITSSGSHSAGTHSAGSWSSVMGTATVGFRDSAGLPDKTVLQAAVLQNGEEYEAYRLAAAGLLGMDPAEADRVQILDLSLLEGDRELEPADQVEVLLQFDNMNAPGGLRVVHFGDSPELLASRTRGDAVRFATRSFSVFAVVSATREVQVTDSDGNVYDISVSYDNTTGIPEGTELAVREILPGEEGYEQYLEQTVRLLGCKEYETDFLKAFDISLVDPESGEEYQPNQNVKVSIRLLDADMAKSGQVDVIHFGRETQRMDCALAAGETGETAEVTFETDGFSVYVVVGHEGGEVVNPRVEFHFLNQEFTETSPGVYSAGLFHFVNKGGTEQTSQILRSGEALEMIANPPNITVEGKSKYFFGWYPVEGVRSGDTVSYTWEADPVRLDFEKTLSIVTNDANGDGKITVPDGDDSTPDDTLTWTVDGVTGTAVLDEEGTAHVYLAPIYEDYYFVNYHLGAKDSEIWGTILHRRLVVLGSDGSATVNIGVMTAPSTDATRQVFAGWETVITQEEQKTENGVPVWLVDGAEVAAAACPEGGAAFMQDLPVGSKTLFPSVDPTTAEEQTATVYASDGSPFTPAQGAGYHIVIRQEDFIENSLDLYPVFAQARWLLFNTGKSGNNATYVPSEYLLTSNLSQGGGYESNYYVTKIPTGAEPTRSGYSFAGWYVDAVLDTETGEFTNLTDAKPVTARYEDEFGNLTEVTESVTARKLTDNTGRFTAGDFQKRLDGKLIYEVHNGRFYVYEELENLTLYARWEPVTVDYAVVYWLENANDDDYTLLTYEMKEGISGTMTAATGISGDGVTDPDSPFYVLKYSHLSADQDKSAAGDQTGIQQKVIEGDGSTIVNIYYDRNVYHLRFDVGLVGRTSTSGSTVFYTALTAGQAASYSGTVYGVEGDAYIPLTPDGNGGWVYDSAATNVAYGIVDGKYVRLVPDEAEETQYYKPKYRYTATTADGDGLYGVDAGGNYVPLDVNATTVPGPTYYILTSSVAAGNDYMIVQRNTAGGGYALLRNNNNGVDRQSVTVAAGIAATGNKVYIAAPAGTVNYVWTAAASGDAWKFTNGGNYIRSSSNNNNSTLQISNTDSNNTWTWIGNSNQLRYTGNTQRYLRYANNAFSLGNANSVYLFEKTDTFSTTYAYTLNGVPYTGTRYTRAGYSGSDEYLKNQLETQGEDLYYVDTAGSYGAPNGRILMAKGRTDVVVNSYKYNGTPYTGTVYMLSPYKGTLFRSETLTGTYTYYVSTITNSMDGGGYTGFLTSGVQSVGTTNLFAAGEYTGMKAATVANNPGYVLYYDLTAKYGEYILDKYPGSSSKKGNYSFVGWIPQPDSYVWATLKSSVKGFFETMSETLILTGNTPYPAYNGGNKINLDPSACVAITVEQNNTISGELGITHEFHCRYKNETGCNYLYRVFLADPETGEYPDDPSMKIVVTAGSGSAPKQQPPPSFFGYTLSQKVVLSNTGSANDPETTSYSAYTIPELTDASVGSGMIMEFRYLPNEHTITFKQTDNTELGSANYNYNQSLADADAYSSVVAASTPQGYSFAGWYENNEGVGNVFNFNTTMPDGDIVLYAVYKPLKYRIMIDPNGGEIDHINHNYDNGSSDLSKKGYSGYWWDASHNAVAYHDGSNVTDWTPFATFNRAGDSGYRNDRSTYFNGTFNETVGYYEMEGLRQYVEISNAEASSLGTGNWFYYLNSQYKSTDGSSLPSDLRNALYLTEAEVDAYYNYYRDWVEGNLQGGYISGTVILGKEAWKDAYLAKDANGGFQKYRRLYSTETYTFLGWYRILYDDEGNEIGPDNMPYNNSDPITGPLTLRAYWRLDGGYRILYTPYYTMPDGTVINGQMEAWTDPQVSTATYADGAKTHIYRQPTGITANGSLADGEEYIFRGWQLVSVKTINDTQIFTPLENNVFYDPGEEFTVSAGYADENGLIYFRAVYEKKVDSYRRPEVANLTLDANSGFITLDGTDPLDGGSNLAWEDSGVIHMDGDNEQIIFGYFTEEGVSRHIRSNRAVHLYQYASKLTEDYRGNALDPVGINYFRHPDGFFLLGFDDAPDENDFLATYPADSIVSVKRTDNRTVYAVWEPMVYLNVVNASEKGPDGSDLVLSLSSDDGTALYVVNEKTGVYDRVPMDDLAHITLEEGETLRLAIPYGKDKSVNISGTNTLGTGMLLYWQGELNGVTEGHSSGDKKNGDGFSFSETLVEDPVGVTVTFRSEKADYTLVLDDNWTGGHRAEVYFSSKNTDSNYVETGYTLPPTSTRLGYEFLGWANTKAKADAGEADHSVDGGMAIADMKADVFDPLDTDLDQIVTLYAVWKAKAEAYTVYVYKNVPEPGDTARDFTFTMNAVAEFTKKNSNTGERWSGSGVYTLKHNQYLRIYTGYDAGNANGTAYVQITVEKFEEGANGADDLLLETYSTLRKTWTNNSTGTGTLTDFSITVEETDYTAAPDYYDTDLEVAAATEAPINKTAVRRISWDQPTAGGTVIYTNQRQTVDVAVKKVLESTSVAGVFNFTASYTADGKTVDRGAFTVSSSSSAGTVLEKIPVGATLTVSETGTDLLDFVTTAAKDGANLTVTVPASTTSGGVTTHYRTVTTEITQACTITYTNVLKSVPVKIVKIGFDGVNTYTDVEAQFTMSSGLSNLFTGRYSTPVSSASPRGNIIFETGKVYSGGTADGRLHIGTYALEETRVFGDYIKLDDSIDIAVTGTADGAVLTADGKGVQVTREGDVWVITVRNRKTTEIKVEAGLLDPMIAQRTFTFTGSYTLEGEQYGLDGLAYNSSNPYSFDLTAYATNDGAVSGALEPKRLVVPLGAEGLVIREDTSKVTVAPETIGSTYTVQTERNTEGRLQANNYAYTAAIAAVNANDTVTFYNIKKTVNITVKKVVETEDLTGTFSFTATLLNGGTPIKGYPIFINGTQTVTDDDEYTNPTTGEYVLTLQNNQTCVLTIPVGSRLTLMETGVAGNATGDDMSIYSTTVATAYTQSGAAYGGNTQYAEDARLYTLTVAPSTDLTVTVTNGSGARDVLFKKIDGYGDPLSGARFSLYMEYACITPVQVRVGDDKVDYAQSAAAFTTTDGVKHNVAFKVAPGVYYMKEENTVSGFETNTRIYRVIVGQTNAAALGVTFPAGSDFLIQRMNSSGAVDEELDVTAYGVMNISASDQMTILKKINTGYVPLENAGLDLFRYDMTAVDKGCVSGTAGAFWIGSLPNGYYYLHETVYPSGVETNGSTGWWYTLQVDGSGVTVISVLDSAPTIPSS